jgi:hypothetical protein
MGEWLTNAFASLIALSALVALLLTPFVLTSFSYSASAGYAYGSVSQRAYERRAFWCWVTSIWMIVFAIGARTVTLYIRS